MSQPLIPDYYTLIDSPEEGTFQLRFHSEHPIFQGHFPGMPIVPGVTMIQIMLELAARQTQRPLRLIMARKVKFLFPINPRQQEQVEFGLSIEPGNPHLRLSCTGFHDGKPFFKFSGTVKPDNQA